MSLVNFDSAEWGSVVDVELCDSGGPGNTLSDPVNGVDFVIVEGKMAITNSSSGSGRFLFASQISCDGTINPKMRLVIRFANPQQYVRFGTDWDWPTDMVLRYYEDHSATNQTEFRRVADVFGGWQQVVYNRPSQPIREMVIETEAPENILDNFEFYESASDIGHDIALALDGSGSMANNNKWSAMVEAADIFHDIYKIVGNDDDGFGGVRFRWDCSNPVGGNQTISQPAFANLGSGVDIPSLFAADSPSSCTPIGTGVLQAASMVAAGTNEAKHILLLTDGKNNRGIPVSSLAGDPSLHGLTLHTIGLGTGAHIDPVEISSLADSNGGSFRQTTDPSDILEFFSQILCEMIDKAEMATVTGDDVIIAPGTDKAIFLIAWDDPTANHNFNIVTPDGVTIEYATPTPPPGMSIDYYPKTAESAHAYFVVEGSALDGVWQFNSVPALASRLAIEDLGLRIEWNVSHQYGLTHQPITIQAQITQDDKPYTGNASIHAQVTLPEEHQGHFIASQMRKHAIKPKTSGDVSFRAQAISAILQANDLKDFRYSTQRDLRFDNLGDGLYQLVFDRTEFDGMYRFDIKATGTNRDDEPLFARHINRSVVLTTHVSGVHETKWEHIDKKLSRLTFTPISTKHIMAGPFFSDQIKLSVGGKTLSHRITDNFDGSYTAIVPNPANNHSALQLAFGKSNVALGTNPSQCRRVKVTLNRIRTLTDKETWFPSPGEMVFDSVVVPNGEPNRLVRRRIPSQGILKLTDGECRDCNEVLFDGFVEEGASLDVSLGGTEYDWLLFFTKKDKYCRYRRKFTGNIASWQGSYGPGDEANDPESLHDWQLWYKIEVSE